MSVSQAVKGQGTVTTIGGNVIAELTKVDRTGGKANFSNVTNMDSTGGYEEMLPTTLVAGDVTIAGNFLGNVDASQEALQTLFDNQTLNACTITLPSGRGTFSFNAYVAEPPNFALEFDKAATFTAKLTITGKPTFA